jgi:hypothetical protein
MLGMLVVGLLVPSSKAAAADSIVTDLQSAALVASEEKNGLAKAPLLLGDRYVYQSQDRYAQFYLMTAPPADAKLETLSIRVELRLADDAKAKPLAFFKWSPDKITGYLAKSCTTY